MIQALQLIVALSFLVLIHEFGHFMFAKLFHVRVEKFYMFFNPQFSIFRAKKFNGKWHFKFFAKNVTEDDEWAKHPENTEWGIGWIPVGGYCAIAGMVDETHDSEQVGKNPPQPWEFRSKNVWQRFCIIIGGIFVNFVAALMIFGLLLFHFGMDTLPLRNVDSGLYFSEIMRGEGFEQHDKILSIDGEEPQDIADVVQWIILEGRRNVIVKRGADTLALTMSEDLGTRYLAAQNEFDRAERDKARADKSYQKRSYLLVTEFIPYVVDSVMPEQAAYYAGIEKGDSLVAVNGVLTPCAVEVIEELRKYPCDSVTIDFYRSGEPKQARLFIGDRAIIGVYVKNKYQYFETEHQDYTFWQSIPAGIKYGWDLLVMYVKQFRLVFTKEGAQSLGGFGAIGNMFPDQWNWFAFWHMTAFLSLILAFMNFLPIPALDGGYILFLIVEMVTRKQPSDKFLEFANNIGFWLLLALLIFANGNDILKYFFM